MAPPILVEELEGGLCAEERRLDMARHCDACAVVLMGAQGRIRLVGPSQWRASGINRALTQSGAEAAQVTTLSIDAMRDDAQLKSASAISSEEVVEVEVAERGCGSRRDREASDEGGVEDDF